MSGFGDRKFNKASIKHGKEKVDEMRKEEQKMKNKIKEEEKQESFKHIH